MSVVTEFKLTYDMLFALIQGKEVQWIDLEGNKIVLHSPLDGVFLTREEVYQLQLESENRVFNIMKIIQEK